MIKKTLLILLSLVSTSAFAHDAGSGNGFMSGVVHPILGLDHLLAMVSVGILSAQLGGKAIWQLPVTFVLVMVVGGVLGILQLPMLQIELGIALSVLVLGAGIALDRKASPFVAMSFAALFAVFHGYAHGAEMPTMATPASYVAGFIVGTASIHIVGVFIGVYATQCSLRRSALRGLGAGIMLSGMYFVAGV